MSVVLGINAYHAGASAALIVDGDPVAAIAEERLNRVKYYAGFPAMAVHRCLDIAGLGLEDVDAVALGRDSKANLAKKMSYVVTHPTRLLNLLKIKATRKDLDDVKSLLVEHCDADPAALRFEQFNVEHHLAHIASAFFCSGWESAAGISIDGSGDFVTCMMAECTGDVVVPVHRIYVPHSLGSLYTMVCQFIGYDKYGDEGKVMGLAALGSNTYKEQFDDMLILEDDGIRLNPKYFLPFGSNQGLHINSKGQVELQRHYSDVVVDLFGAPLKRYGEITRREQDLAFGLQYIFELGYLHLLNILHRKVPHHRVALAGGCALNSVANGMLYDETPFRESFVQPAAGDDGLALGAALYVSRSIRRETGKYRMVNAFLGPAFSDETIETELTARGVKFDKLDRGGLLRETCDALVEGKVVGWFQGRMEWGPRALGNRSILAHPGLPDMKSVLNARIKHREPFRPFAPSILAERQSDVFECDEKSPFMLHVYKIRPEWRDRLPAVLHVDDTGRLQSVAREENPLYYDLIERFERQTGIPILLNTSFNENEPIVCNPADAIDCFLRTRMDALSIGSYFCMKESRGAVR
ncbi:MAG TPA: carbamoyltransferase C-terminal domain-containing protein [Rhodothermales bacterium]|nr:carbamoyltransferase C-terminal domain-containing protein [Rhodothermales bacterium]